MDNVRITSSIFLATSVTVGITALKAFAICRACILNKLGSGWTFKSRTTVLQTATLVEVCTCAVLIIATYRRSISIEQIIRWTNFLHASAFSDSTHFQVSLVGADCACTLNFVSIRPLYIPLGQIVKGVAPSYFFAASVKVIFSACVKAAVQLLQFLTGFRDVTFGAMESAA
jgi:hypothetical protein